MLVGVCDFPGSYAFPPHRYGGIERWLWATALGARQTGAEVHLLGPAWRSELASDWTIRPHRLEDLESGSSARAELRAARYDLLIVGHEYPSLPTWRAVSDELECDVATFQHDPDFQHQPDVFDQQRYRLYCYSPEMLERYQAHAPIRALSVQIGLNETEPSAAPGADLVWVGRVDEQKSPHLAVMAAGLLRRRIHLVGPVFDSDYYNRHATLFASDHVHIAGELGGAAKTAAFAHASACVYTCGRTYVEAGVATLGESLRAGTAVAALAWRHGTCAEVALCESTGAVAVVDPFSPDEHAAYALAQAIAVTDGLDAPTVQAIGLERFDPATHFTILAARP